MKKNNLLLSSLLILLLIIGCKKIKENESLEENNKIIISGEFKNIISIDSLSNIGIYAKDYLTKDITTTEKKVDSSGRFKFEIELTNQQDIMILYNTIISLIVKPGDSIHLILNSQSKSRKDILKNLDISGTATNINNNLTDFFINDPIDYDIFRENRQKLNSFEFKIYRDSVYKEQAYYAEKLISTNTFSISFKNWLEAQKLFARPSNYSFFEFYSSNKNLEEINNKELHKSKYDINDLPKLLPKHYINTVASNNIPKKILDYTIISSQNKASVMESSKRDKFYIEKIIENYSKKPHLLKSIVNEYTKSQLNQESIDFYEKNKATIDSILNKTEFENSLKIKYSNVKERINNPKLSDEIYLIDYESSDVEGLIKKIVLEANGKPIYIDNWATWCSPCISEFKENTPKLISQFENSIEFVFLCYKSNKTQWKSIISKYNLEGKHYFIEDNQIESLIDLFSINGYPTYTIIDREGKVIESGNSFSPSNPETVKFLNELTIK
jgi:thiol-disulfide isomerase/thioredoxin